jgi:hypothetical protein
MKTYVKIKIKVKVKLSLWLNKYRTMNTQHQALKTRWGGGVEVGG